MSANTLHASGSFGSSRGVESVTTLMTRFFSRDPESKMPIVLSYVFDIFRPSTPGTTAT